MPSIVETSSIITGNDLSLIMFQTLLGLSVMGTLFDGYFFAFHMLNIVANNQLLKGVVKAVTQNGTIFYHLHESACN